MRDVGVLRFCAACASETCIHSAARTHTRARTRPCSFLHTVFLEHGFNVPVTPTNSDKDLSAQADGGTLSEFVRSRTISFH